MFRPLFSFFFLTSTGGWTAGQTSKILWSRHTPGQGKTNHSNSKNKGETKGDNCSIAVLKNAIFRNPCHFKTTAAAIINNEDMSYIDLLYCHRQSRQLLAVGWPVFISSLPQFHASRTQVVSSLSSQSQTAKTALLPSPNQRTQNDTLTSMNSIQLFNLWHKQATVTGERTF